MATIRLVPSTYYLSNSNYLSVSDASNMYENTDSTTYATITNTQKSTNRYYIYIRGFNFDDIPSDATINSFYIKLKGYETGGNTNTSYGPRLCNSTSQLTGYPDATLTESINTITFDGDSLQVDFDTIKSYGSNFGIRVNCQRSKRNITSYFYIYGAEIEVNYTPATVNIKTKVNGTWTEGTLKAKVNGEWRDASEVYLKNNGTWTKIK